MQKWIQFIIRHGDSLQRSKELYNKFSVSQAEHTTAIAWWTYKPLEVEISSQKPQLLRVERRLLESVIKSFEIIKNLRKSGIHLTSAFKS